MLLVLMELSNAQCTFLNAQDNILHEFGYLE